MRKLVAIAAFVTALVVAPTATANAPTWGEVFGTSKVTRADTPAVNGCWYTTWTQQHSGWWGYWRHWQSTYWCGNGSAISYRVSSDGAAAGGLCHPAYGPNTWRTWGGVGYQTVRVKTQTTFSCYGGYLHGSPWMENAYHYSGLSWNYDWGWR
jgi:hypothetical protein